MTPSRDERPAARRWRETLEAWALPERVLAAVPDSPYEWPAHLFARMHTAAAPDPVTGPLLRRLLGRSGSLLDVGAGTGRVSLPFAADHRVTAVEPSDRMSATLREEAAAGDVDVEVIAGRWPGASITAGRHDVVVTANVVYDVHDIGPFVGALHSAADSAVVVELTGDHPWSRLTPYYRDLHGLTRPDGPTVDDFIAVVVEATGIDPHRTEWMSRRGLVFPDRGALIEFYGRRLCVPGERRDELEARLAPDVVETGGGLMLGPPGRAMATVWWGRGA